MRRRWHGGIVFIGGAPPRHLGNVTHGGFGGAPKFPPASALEFLLARGSNEHVALTLDAMLKGGIYDQIGGGFEARISPRLRFAGEVQYTILQRDLSYAAGEVAPLITSCVFAIDGRF